MVTVIIPTLNAERYMHALMKLLRAQSIPCEIVIVDSSSEDETRNIASSYGARVITIDRKLFDHGRTRNQGVKASTGDTLVFLTQDAVPADNRLLENLTRPLKDEEIALCYGRQVASSDASPLERFARAFNYPGKPLIKAKEDIEALGIKTFFSSNVCSAVRRGEFEAEGGFPDDTILNEDMIFASRVLMKGYKIAYEPSATVYHSHNYTLIGQFKRYFDIGVSLNRNRHILEMARSEGEGVKFLREQVAHLVREGMWRWIPYGFIEAVFKYSGYQMGLREDKLPLPLKVHLSMHRGYWLKYNKTSLHKEDA